MTERILTGTLALAMLAVLLAGGAQPVAVGLFAAPWDKLAHLAYFMALALLLLQVLPRRVWLAVVIALSVGAADELHQLLLTGREASLVDWFADAIGVGLAVLVHRACRRCHRTLFL